MPTAVGGWTGPRSVPRGVPVISAWTARPPAATRCSTRSGAGSTSVPPKAAYRSSSFVGSRTPTVPFLENVTQTNCAMITSRIPITPP